jgi:hypothetical protein
MDVRTASSQWQVCAWCGREEAENYGNCLSLSHNEHPSMVPLNQLEHGAYYHGVCRNGRVARWNAEAQHFIHWRVKFASVFTETIGYWVEAQPGEHRWDEFKPYGKLEKPPFEIPLAET